ncbi:hypothetical protein GLOIN_2v1842955 [Rhizophagus irregularis DAOM 181602=DAOM 197198]|uniref:BTB domain-containing protein n=3 Tax=Rhizophagus irregularis TaxID=588596 RepID=U9TW12_RHIID|nr:hypothetical protein GLOIN_2v1842955 [Rhizophagus irregularis DAOM 181602=DAOM 197198]EXX56505.1 hypothetical protein RirG_215580 [Rhizophagus irregularis DAOM 197198w]POG68443.1 hypothetical protein GLOIN_2v1842955 [Rhizophagus irregularis DAOM 181602=DAOM 197198]GBC38283.1 hypothetical protein GLOIN_2v1842955 [Rhizophagus irregularis DAOM 181602=DAOM 197198]|eukprot:XP_025175309.1 hypothetical protein GLOIN_2v1842955 [Rhizophagus irregularis DAOM 181602=DAOM 197198]
MTSIFHSGFSKDFSSILNDVDDYNVIIQVGENNNIKEFKAHSAILCARSEYFKGALSNNWVTKKNGMIIYEKPNITPKVFDMILKYINTGDLNLEKHLLIKDIFELLVASDELILEELFEHVQDYLIKKRKTWIKEKNFDFFFNTAFKLVSCKRLQDLCLETICKNSHLYITSKNFLLLDKDILYSLLEREDLQIDEIIIWESLVKWGIKQTPSWRSKNNNRTEWNNEKYEALKKTLDELIPLIRFVDISPSKYSTRVRPYNAIIPNHIYDEIEEFYLKGTLKKATILPPRVGRIRFKSKIIKKKLISIIINWINKNDAKVIPDKNDLTYNFNLISKDGIKSQSFINKCRTGKPILVLVKCKNSRKIFGGYKSIGFYNNNNNPLPNEFIFSFENDEDIQNMRLSRIKPHNYFCYSGFIFGERNLYMQGNNLYVKYDRKIGCSGTYIIDEVEVFSVVGRKIIQN